MLKDKSTHEMNRERYIAEGKKLAEEKANKDKFRKATPPISAGHYH